MHINIDICNISIDKGLWERTHASDNILITNKGIRVLQYW